MLEYVIALILILGTLLFFMTRAKKEETPKPKSHKQEKEVTKKPEIKKEEISVDKTKIADHKSFLINSFKEGKDLMDPFSTQDGKTILFHDDKKIMLGFLNNFEEKNPKFLTKSVEQDVICDASYSEEKK